MSPPFYCIDKVEIRAPQEAADDSVDNLLRGELVGEKNAKVKRKNAKVCLPVVVLFAILRGWT